MKFCSKNGRRDKRGFTLLEVGIAAVILGLTVASTIVAMRVGFATIESARDNTLASQILQSEMEKLRLKNWSDVTELSDGPFTIESTFQGTVADRFECYREVENVRPGLRRITLEVRWSTSSGRDVNRKYGTVFSKSGLNDYYYRALPK